MKTAEQKLRWSRNWAKKNPERKKELWKLWKYKLKEEVFTAYGGQCHCCGEKRYEFLTIDHIRNDGGAHRKELDILYPGGKRLLGDKFYRWIRKSNYPKKLGLKVACFNCNMARQYFGYCPHK